MEKYHMLLYDGVHYVNEVLFRKLRKNMADFFNGSHVMHYNFIHFLCVFKQIGFIIHWNFLNKNGGWVLSYSYRSIEYDT
jgi:hypothetical protein